MKQPSVAQSGAADRNQPSADAANDRSVTGTEINFRQGYAGDKVQAIPDADHLPWPLSGP
jgi:hypothetical protein